MLPSQVTPPRQSHLPEVHALWAAAKPKAAGLPAPADATPCTRPQSASNSLEAASKPEAAELPAAAAQALLALYRERAPGKVAAVEAALQRQGVV